MVITIPPERPAETNVAQEKMASLDLILFKGKNPLHKVIQLGEELMVGNGTYGHIGLVIRPEDLLDQDMQLDLRQVYVLESTLLSQERRLRESKEVKLDQVVVSLRPLSKVKQEFNGSVAWAPLTDNPFRQTAQESLGAYVNRKLKLRSQLTSTVKKEIAAIDKSNTSTCLPLKVLLAIASCGVKPARDVRTLIDIIQPDLTGYIFSSEIVARIYQSFELITKDFDARDILPMDFLGFDKDGLPNLAAYIFTLE